MFPPAFFGIDVSAIPALFSISRTQDNVVAIALHTSFREHLHLLESILFILRSVGLMLETSEQHRNAQL